MGSSCFACLMRLKIKQEPKTILCYLLPILLYSITGIVSQLIPWGNAVTRSDGTILCQHREAECTLNTVHVCAINAYPDVMKHFGYIYCTERLVLENKVEKWADCLEMVGLSRAVVDCYINGYGSQVNLAHCHSLNRGMQKKRLNYIQHIDLLNSSVEKLSNIHQVCYANH